MKKGPLTELLLERFDSMPPRLQAAGRFVLDHPDDVALMSMREQANQAGVSHSTMMRLARCLGLESYEEMRALYAKGLRDPERAFDASDLAVVDEEGQEGFSLVGRMSDTLAAQVTSVGDYVNARQLLQAAETLAGARRLFSLGLRSEHPVAHHFAHALSLMGEPVTLLEGAGGAGVEFLRDAGPGDAMLAIALEPYTRATIEIARQGRECGVAVVAITDSQVSPLARLARESLVVTAHAHVGFQSMVPALAAAEILAALTAAHRGIDVDKALQKTKERLATLEVYWRR
ncbi:MurR/RpiR family transcriptional regulator [Chelativorans alearense]|uniref:MurR/RpiR family transcriptional regulator n=1 Tax=Chelativorans alearense TaxID=2681495 RepID=UPI0013D26040|nr:MurR/RpiR family transcriptional regulator [Chelativorans alearense]